MLKFQHFDTFGELNHAFHEGTSLLVHTKNEQIAIYDFNTLKEIARTSFKQPIVRTLIPLMNKQLGFRGIVVTEDQMAHLIVLKQNTLKKSVSYDLGQKLTLCYTLLLDAQLHSYVLFENSVLALISQKKTEKVTLKWPPKSMIRITHFEPFHSFEGQHAVSPNSAGFLAYHYAGDTCQITSWILTFPKRHVINGPYSIQVNPNSFFLSPYYFLHGDDVYSMRKLAKIGTLSNPYCCSTYAGETTIVSDSEGKLSKISDFKIEPLRDLSSTPLRVEYNGEKYVYLTMSGMVNDKLNLGVSFPLSEWAGIFIHGNYPKINPGPLIPEPQPKPCAVKYEEKLITSASGGKWTPPHKIVSFNSIRNGQYDFFIAATAGTIHIMKSHLKNPSILPVTECNWENPISAVAINTRLFAVASIDRVIKVQQYAGEDYSFSFQSSLCLCLSLSDETLACGFSDGSFILTSLKSKSQIISIKPFRVPIHKVSHVDEESILVQWGGAIGKISTKSFEWVKLPSFPGAMTAVFGRQGMVSFATPKSVDVYSFADQQLMAKIPQRAVGICSNNRRTYILTIKNEVVVLHYHTSLKVESQYVIDVDNPYAILGSDDILYVLCQKAVVLFDKSGKKLEEIELDLTPHYYDLSPKGIYLVMHRSVWFFVKKDNIKKIPMDISNICGFSAVDETRFVIAAAGRIYYCDHSGSKPSFSTLAKFEKNIIGIKCYPAQLNEKNDMIIAIYTDHTSSRWPLPTPKGKS